MKERTWLGILLSFAAPVSYTHLDVYKRQADGHADLWPYFGNPGEFVLATEFECSYKSYAYLAHHSCDGR